MLSILFPEPGGPMRRILWLPAAATSRARFTFSCPSTSLKSGPGSPLPAGTQTGSEESSISPFIPRTSSSTVCTGIITGPRARVASAAFWAGTKSLFTPSCFAARAMGRTPETPRSFPSKLTSPRNASPGIGFFTSPEAARMLNRMGRS